MQPWGRYSLCLALPAATIRFTGLSAAQLESLNKSYRGFVASGPYQDDRILECRVRRLKSALTVSSSSLTRDGQYTPRKTAWPNKKGFQLVGINFEAQIGLAPSHRLARLAVAREDEFPRANVVENFLRYVVSHNALQLGGLVLHSCGLVVRGKAYVFSGRSNSGKTTLARKAHTRGATILSDDINLLLPAENAYHAHAVPFTGEFGRSLDHVGGRNSYPVKAVILLEQREQLTTERVRPAEGVATLLTGCPFVNMDAHLSAPLFDAVTNLVATVPVIRLGCRREDGIEDIMAAVTARLDREDKNNED